MTVITSDQLRAFDNGILFLTKSQIIDYQKEYVNKVNFCDGHNKVILEILDEYEEIIKENYLGKSKMLVSDYSFKETKLALNLYD